MQLQNNWLIYTHLLLLSNPTNNDKKKLGNELDLHLDIINKIDKILKSAPKHAVQPNLSTTKSTSVKNPDSFIEQRQPLQKQIQPSQTSLEEEPQIEPSIESQIHPTITSSNSDFRFINSLDEISLDVTKVKPQHIEIIDIPTIMKNANNNFSSFETANDQIDTSQITRKIEVIDITRNKNDQPQHKSTQTKLLKPPTPPHTIDIPKVIDTINNQIMAPPRDQEYGTNRHHQKSTPDINATQALIKIGHRNKKNHRHTKEPSSNEQAKDTNQLYYMQTLTKNYPKNDKDMDNLQKELERIQTEFKHTQKQIKEKERQAREQTKHKKKQQHEKLHQQKHLEREKKIEARKIEKEHEKKIREKLLKQKQK